MKALTPHTKANAARQQALAAPHATLITSALYLYYPRYQGTHSDV